jgi:hypothetical protein
MNDKHSVGEWKYKERSLAPSLREAASEHPVVILTGPRQVGKSTLLREEPPFSGWRYRTLDDMDVRAQARREPEALWAGTDRVVLDEVQRAPRLLDAIKREVDRRRRRVRFVLTGSANLALLSSVSESLAGRAVTFSLHPMTLCEARGEAPSGLLPELLRGSFPDEGAASAPGGGAEVDLGELLVRGLMPPVIQIPSLQGALRWWEGYVGTYLERDLRQLSQVESLVDFRRVMGAFALRTGQLMNQTDVARDVGVSQPTVHRYLGLLETSMVAVRLQAFHRSRGKRLTKRPKIYSMDPALAAFLASLHDERAILGSREAGGLFEALVLLHLRAAADLLVPRARIFYWRTTTGREVDFVVEKGRDLLALEVKLTSRPGYDDARNLSLFLQEHPETRAAVLLHTGSRIHRLSDRIVAIPWHRLG